MDNIRIFLWVGLLMLVWLTVTTWQQTFRVAPGAVSQPVTEAAGDVALQPPALPSLQAAPDSPPTVTTALPGAPAELPAPGGLPPLRVRTDVLDLEIDLLGGNLRRALLPSFPVHKDQPDVPVELLTAAADRFFALQGGLRAADELPQANHLATFSAATTDFVLPARANELQVPLTWTGDNGVTVTKTYTLRRGSFRIGLTHDVQNGGVEPYQVAEYLQLQRQHRPPDRSMFDVETYSFTGPVTYDGSKYTKHDVDDLAKKAFSQAVTSGWLASIQHHFLVAAVPPPDAPWAYGATSSPEGRYLVNAIGPARTVAPGDSIRFSSQLFVGPKQQAELATTAPGLDKTVDYGILAILSQPLFWILAKIYSVVGNWGVAIIICTLLIKLVFYKLTETSGRSMAGMRKLQPRMKALQERYKDDRQAMSAALMELYKKEKINPVAGCLPMLVQIPFFIAFYWVLLESVEMRQAPFALWITDLSARDPYFILPGLMGAAMYFQQKLNPAPPDPIQAKMMQIMPIVFTGFFLFFPAGLVLYWLTNSVLSIAQQWRINKVLGAD